MSDTLGAIIQASSDARNNLLKGALGGRTATAEQFDQLLKESGIGYKTLTQMLKNCAREHGIDIDQMILDNGIQRFLKNNGLPLIFLKNR